MKKFFCAITLALVILFGGATSASADTGKAVTATIRIGSAGYGTFETSSRGRYYHLTPGRAGLSIQSISGGTWEVYLYKGSKLIDSCVGITGRDWRRFYNIPSDSSDYWLKFACSGRSGRTETLKVVLHDHGDI